MTGQRRGAPGERLADNPVPSATTGTLIGRVGNGQPFAIGSQTSVQMPAAGQLFLGVNDTHLDDNDGSFQVRIQRGGAARPRQSADYGDQRIRAQGSGLRQDLRVSGRRFCLSPEP